MSYIMQRRVWAMNLIATGNVFVVTLLLAISGCGSDAQESRGSSDGMAGGAGESGAGGGDSGRGGDSSAGSSGTHEGGAAGMARSEGGQSGTGSESACAPCYPEAPVCDEVSGECRVCTAEQGCSSDAPMCDVNANNGLGRCITPPTYDLDGTWSGTSNEDRPVNFNVDGSMVNDFTMPIRLTYGTLSRVGRTNALASSRSGQVSRV